MEKRIPSMALVNHVFREIVVILLAIIAFNTANDKMQIILFSSIFMKLEVARILNIERTTSGPCAGVFSKWMMVVLFMLLQSGK